MNYNLTIAVKAFLVGFDQCTPYLKLVNRMHHLGLNRVFFIAKSFHKGFTNHFLVIG